MYMGIFLATISAIIWSGNFILARGVAETIPPVTLALARWTIGLLCALPFALPKFKQDWPLIKKHWFYLTAISITGITLLNTFYYIAGRTAPAINMSIIATSAPVYIMILCKVFNNEPLEGRRLFGLVATILGVLVLISKGDVMHLTSLKFTTGDLWSVAAAAMFGIYSYLMRNKPKDISGIGFLAITFAIGIVFLIPLEIWELYYNYDKAITGLSNGNVLLGILYAGVFCSFICFFLWMEAIKYIGPVMAGIIYNSLPVFAATGAVLILNETFIFAQLIGSVMVIGGILFATVHPSAIFSHKKH